MISQDLLEILACPETKQPVTLVGEEQLKLLNERISKGELCFVDGDVVEEALQAALIREDQKLAYQIKDSIPVMLVEKGIVI